MADKPRWLDNAGDAVQDVQRRLLALHKPCAVERALEWMARSVVRELRMGEGGLIMKEGVRPVPGGS
jgi:hypothetical protein